VLSELRWKLLPCILCEKYIYILALERNQQLWKKEKKLKSKKLTCSEVSVTVRGIRGVSPVHICRLLVIIVTIVCSEIMAFTVQRNNVSYDTQI